MPENFYKNLKEKSSQPVIFHVFSNGGANIYSKLIKEIYQYNSVFNYQPIHVAGVVFDSCPGRPRPFTGMKAALVSGNSKYLQPFQEFCFSYRLHSYYVFLYILFGYLWRFRCYCGGHLENVGMKKFTNQIQGFHSSSFIPLATNL